MQIKNKVLIKGLFFAYVLCLCVVWFKITDFIGTRSIIETSREGGFWSVNLSPLYTIKSYILKNRADELIKNIVAFMPMGILYPLVLTKKKTAFLYFLQFLLFITVVEGIQFVAMVGYFDVDDILLGFVGFLCGFVILALGKWCAEIYRRKAASCGGGLNSIRLRD